MYLFLNERDFYSVASIMTNCLHSLDVECKQFFLDTLYNQVIGCVLVHRKHVEIHRGSILNFECKRGCSACVLLILRFDYSTFWLTQIQCILVKRDNQQTTKLTSFRQSPLTKYFLVLQRNQNKQANLAKIILIRRSVWLNGVFQRNQGKCYH